MPTVKSLAELTMPQIRAIIERAEIKAEGIYQDPPLDIEAIQIRADMLDPGSQTKADLYSLIKVARRLQKAFECQPDTPS